ncbi:hypothetical protein KC678_00920 [Candidatus Dojkabacteria bacterium]|uniref:Uncharacterized protein n=1 Tax=Candidatus Dojkabacteria bacterium TaxID=2099670 RepID=A0A955L0A6_9BACT|nr:hypothetical protein [Candidatus Dojkabacteria bacterium]
METIDRTQSTIDLITDYHADEEKSVQLFQEFKRVNPKRRINGAVTVQEYNFELGCGIIIEHNPIKINIYAFDPDTLDCMGFCAFSKLELDEKDATWIGDELYNKLKSWGYTHCYSEFIQVYKEYEGRGLAKRLLAFGETVLPEMSLRCFLLLDSSPRYHASWKKELESNLNFWDLSKNGKTKFLYIV